MSKRIWYTPKIITLAQNQIHSAPAVPASFERMNYVVKHYNNTCSPPVLCTTTSSLTPGAMYGVGTTIVTTTSTGQFTCACS